MPVYLCKPGWSSEEPWRHGVQVYLEPFQIDGISDYQPLKKTDGSTYSGDADTEHRFNTSIEHDRIEDNHSRELSRGSTSMHRNENELLSNTQYFDAIQSRSIGHDTNDYKSSRESSGNEATSTNIIRDNGIALRRIRHSEVVLADQVSVEYGRYWLRLRWPGEQGGFAGFIALGPCSPNSSIKSSSNGMQVKYFDKDTSILRGEQAMRNNSEDVIDSVGMSPTVADGTVDDDIITFGPHTSDLIGASDNESLPDSRTKARNSSFREALLQTNNLPGKYNGEEVMQLGGTIKDMNVLFPSSVAMELLTEYDDGISCKIIDESGTNECGEPVFCRICREGLHDVTFDPSSAQSSKNVSRREFHVVSRSSSEDEINQVNAQTMNISRLGRNGNRLVGHEGEEKAVVYGANHNLRIVVEQ